MERTFKIDITKRPGAVILAVDGELDVATAPLLAERLVDPETNGSDLIVIDIAAVPFIDSTGLRALLQAHTRAVDRLRITRGCDQAQRLFELAGVLETLPFLSESERRQLEG